MKLRYLSGILLLAAGLLTTACTEDVDYTVATGEIISEVTTGSASVTAVSATLTGTVKDLSSVASSSYTVGAYYGTSSDPTTSGTRKIGSIDDDGTVTAELTELTTGTTYYYAIYVTLQSEVTYFGDIKSFVATQAAADASAASDISACSATITVDLSGISGLDDYSYGLLLSDTEDEVTDGVEFTPGTLSGLLPGHTYYYTAYVQVGDGYVYDETQSFTTDTQSMEYVDLGLSVLWATCNIGAETESEVGALLGYGDVTGLLRETSVNAYPSDDIAATSDDVAYSLGLDSDSPMSSQLPTATHIAELVSGTTQTWETVDGVEGMRFTASNGNSIFLPAAGYRSGEEETADASGYYWSGSVNATNSDYATTLAFSSSSAKSGNSKRSLGLSVRSVRPYAEVTPDEAAIVWGDIEGAGTFRIEIYNEYGSTVSNPPIDPSSIKFSSNMVVSFTLSGIDNNLVDGAAGTYVAGLEYADSDWWPGYWSGLSMAEYEAQVTGDGTYTVWMETDSEADGAVVFCVDIGGLAADIADMDAVTVSDVTIKLDADVYQSVNADIVEFNNKDGNGTDGRIEIYNEYGNSGSTANGYYNSSLTFNGMMIVDFSIAGIDGNLVDGASASYSTELSYAAASWWPSYWGGESYGSATVTGDGSYRVYTYLNGDCIGAVVWTIEIYGLWADLVDTSAVTVSIDQVITPGKE